MEMNHRISRSAVLMMCILILLISFMLLSGAKIMPAFKSRAKSENVDQSASEGAQSETGSVEGEEQGRTPDSETGSEDAAGAGSGAATGNAAPDARGDGHSETSYVLPQPVNLPVPQGSPAPTAEFRPFGWSEDGRFAYLSVIVMAGRGGVVYRYTILDAVTDEELFLLEDDSYDWGDEAESMDGPSAAESWRRSGPAVSKALIESGIIQSGGLVIESFPLRREGMELTSEVLADIDPEGDPGFDELASYEVWMRRSGKDAKRLTLQSDVFAVRAFVAGFISSPFEPRVLAAVFEERYVFEGMGLHLKLFGSGLESGFSPRSVLRSGTVTGSYRHEHGAGSLDFVEHPDGTLEVEGYAEWVGRKEGAVNLGEISGTALYSGSRAVYDDGWGCRLEFAFSPGAVHVTEYGSCGGLNVSFAGGYGQSR
jgi:hypothetical protein